MIMSKPCDSCRFLSTMECGGRSCEDNSFSDYSPPLDSIKNVVYKFNQEESNSYNKIDQHKAGAKLDHDKPRTNLVLSGFSKALLEVSKVGTFGAKKYSDDGWKEVPNGIDRYSSALLRHYFAEQVEYLDSETNLSHAAAVAWNALARLELILNEQSKEIK